MMGHSPDLALPYDLKFARQCLSEAGYPDGKGFPVLRYGSYSLDVVSREIMLQFKENLGIEMEHVIVPIGFASEDYQDVNIFGAGWVADYPDPDNFLRQSTAITALNMWGWREEHFLNLVDEAADSSDRLRRMDLYRQADRILVNDQVVVVPIAYRDPTRMDLIQPSIDKIEVSVLGYILYKYIKLDR